MTAFDTYIKENGLVLVDMVTQNEIKDIKEWSERKGYENLPLTINLESNAYLEVGEQKIFGEKFSMPVNFFKVAPISRILMIVWDSFDSKIAIRSQMSTTDLIDWLAGDIERNEAEYKEKHKEEMVERLFDEESADTKILKKLSGVAKEINGSQEVHEKMKEFFDELENIHNKTMELDTIGGC